MQIAGFLNDEAHIVSTLYTRSQIVTSMQTKWILQKLRKMTKKSMWHSLKKAVVLFCLIHIYTPVFIEPSHITCMLPIMELFFVQFSNTYFAILHQGLVISHLNYM